MADTGRDIVRRCLEDSGLSFWCDQYLMSDTCAYLMDFYLPDMNLAIAIRGQNDFRPEYGSVAVGKDFLQKRALLAQEQGMGLVQLFEHDFHTGNRWDVVKQRLSAFGKQTRIGARQCRFSTVDSARARKFLSRYHTQGYINTAQSSYGLFYGDDLVSVMLFGKSRYNAYDMELLRYCTEPRFGASGGFSKLLADSLRDMSFHGSLVSFMDLNCRFSAKSVYDKYGFSFDGLTEPDYVWVSEDRYVLSRYACMKHRLVQAGFDASMSEAEIMHSRGYEKLYGAGSARYVLMA